MSVSNIDTVVSRRLRLLRLLQRVAVDEFADRFAITPDYVAECELGRSRFQPLHIAAVAEHFRLPIGWFFFTFDDPAFEDAVLLHVEKAAGSQCPRDIQFLSRISEIVAAMPSAKGRERGRYVEQARMLMRERSCA
jgi:transcriptional regulator with XRE-family HTH domain